MAQVPRLRRCNDTTRPDRSRSMASPNQARNDNPAAAKRATPQGPTRMTPSEAFVETLAANGVTDMFGIMGSAFMDAMDIFAPAGIRLIPVVHEQGAGHMA